MTTKNEFKFGTKVRHIFKNKEGYIHSIIKYSTGCTDLVVAWLEKDGDNDKLRDSFNMFEYVDAGMEEQLTGSRFNQITDINQPKFTFQDEVKDIYSGFIGKVNLIHVALTGDVSYSVVPAFDRESRNNDPDWFDESRLTLINAAPKPEKKETQKRERVGGSAAPIKKHSYL